MADRELRKSVGSTETNAVTLKPPPVFVVVNRDESTRLALAATIARRYSPDFEVETASTWHSGKETLIRLRESGRVVPLIISDPWPDASTGMALLDEARRSHPSAKRVLLIPPGSAAQPALRGAMALGHVDGWLTQPWEPPDRLLFPAITELLEEWFEETIPWEFAAVTVIGEPSSQRSFEFRDLLRRNDVPHKFVEANTEPGRKLLADVGQNGDRLPVALLHSGQLLIQPTNDDVARALGVRTTAEAEPYDLVVVGAGPAGLSAAVYGASEGLRTALIEREAFGGQAGTTSRIRNYLGFPRGVSGLRLGRRATQQAILFGADAIYGEAISLDLEGSLRILGLRDGGQIRARAVVIATGVTYRRLAVPSVERLLGAGVFYGSAMSEAPAFIGEDVVVVGGGNSAGQAAAYLARFARSVILVVRGKSLAASMSDYLIRLLESLENVEIRSGTQVLEAVGSVRLEGVTLAAADSPPEIIQAAAVFILIGTQPHTEWLVPGIRTDQAGYVLTGREAVDGDALSYPAGREPYPYETSTPGVFAVGDVRANSVKRVASGVGEGSVAISQVHQYLDPLPQPAEVRRGSP